jgi:hypothetical protein
MRCDLQIDLRVVKFKLISCVVNLQIDFMRCELQIDFVRCEIQIDFERCDLQIDFVRCEFAN